MHVRIGEVTSFLESRDALLDSIMHFPVGFCYVRRSIAVLTSIYGNMAPNRSGYSIGIVKNAISV